MVRIEKNAELTPPAIVPPAVSCIWTSEKRSIKVRMRINDMSGKPNSTPPHLSFRIQPGDRLDRPPWPALSRFTQLLQKAQCLDRGGLGSQLEPPQAQRQTLPEVTTMSPGLMDF